MEAILTYHLRDSPVYASELIDTLLEQAMSILEHLKRGRILPEIDDPSVRELFVSPYRMMYSLEENLIRIIGIVHMSRGLRNYWREQ